MPKALIDFADGLSKFEHDPAEAKNLEDVRPDIYALLKRQVGHDFSGYKTKTFNRRVQRLMQVMQMRPQRPMSPCCRGILECVSPERRDAFFSADGGTLVLNKEIRDLCVFSPHSIIRDPPFSRMDLVSCRNLLIYFGPEIQNEVVPIFYYSLRPPNGFLFLGKSENVSQYSDLFVPVDKKNRIFPAREGARHGLRMPLTVSDFKSSISTESSANRDPSKGPLLRQIVESHVMERFAPPHVVVNSEGDVVHYSSRTGKYLEAALGAPTRQLLALARRGLRLDLRSALRDATERGKQVVR